MKAGTAQRIALNLISSLLMIQRLEIGSGAVLQRGAVYIIPLLESLHLPPGTLAKANPKSTTGRLDVFARLIGDTGFTVDQTAERERYEFETHTPRIYIAATHEVA